MSDKATAAETPHVILENPIQRGETTITRVDLRKPKAGELRGLSLQDLGRSDVNALITIIPRISSPALTNEEASALEVEDLAAFGGVVFDFFLTPAARAQIREALGG